MTDRYAAPLPSYTPFPEEGTKQAQACENQQSRQCSVYVRPSQIQAERSQPKQIGISGGFQRWGWILLGMMAFLLVTGLIYHRFSTVGETTQDQTVKGYLKNRIAHKDYRRDLNAEEPNRLFSDQNQQKTRAHLEDPVSDAFEGMTSGVSSVANKVGNTVSGVWQGAKDIGRGAVRTTGNAASSTWEGMKDVGRTITGSHHHNSNYHQNYDGSHEGLFGAVRQAGRGVYSGVARVGRGTRRVSSALWGGAERLTRSILY